MPNYFDNLNETLKEYFRILSPEIPDFLEQYIQTPEMQKQAGISVTCGIYYTQLQETKLWYSSLDHSVAVALIIWNFTKDKKQTLSGLFHDIATPVFKHSIDFLYGDYEKQETTEDLTTEIIKNSKEIMGLLKRDNIKLEEVDDYHKYPIADNDTPQLSADRLEYTLSNGLGVRKEVWNLKDVKEVYQNIEIQKNEKGIDELGFKDVKIAEKFINSMKQLSCVYMSDEQKYTMQFFADIIKKMFKQKLINKKDLYSLSEKEIIERIEKCQYDDIGQKFKIWKNATSLYESNETVRNKYCVGVKVKVRYINPLVRQEIGFVRIKEISEKAKKDIEECLNYQTKKYVYLDFDF